MVSKKISNIGLFFVQIVYGMDSSEIDFQSMSQLFNLEINNLLEVHSNQKNDIFQNTLMLLRVEGFSYEKLNSQLLQKCPNRTSPSVPRDTTAMTTLDDLSKQIPELYAMRLGYYQHRNEWRGILKNLIQEKKLSYDQLYRLPLHYMKAFAFDRIMARPCHGDKEIFYAQLLFLLEIATIQDFKKAEVIAQEFLAEGFPVSYLDQKFRCAASETFFHSGTSLEQVTEKIPEFKTIRLMYYQKNEQWKTFFKQLVSQKQLTAQKLQKMPTHYKNEFCKTELDHLGANLEWWARFLDNEGLKIKENYEPATDF